MSKQLNNDTDFKWYKKEMEVQNRSEEHKGAPKEYPCKVQTIFDDGDYGDYTNRHIFLYQKEVKCEHCEHSKKVWDEEEWDYN